MYIDFWVGSRPSSDFSCRLLASWSVEGASPSRTILQGQNGTAFSVFGTSIGLKTIKLPVHIVGRSPREASLQHSQLTAALLASGIVELRLPDGFLYRAALTGVGSRQEITVDGGRISCEYTLQGLQCDELERCTVADGALYVSGTHPSMDCCLTATVEAVAEQYNMAGVTWRNVQPGDILVLDGLRKRMTKNDANAALENDAAGWPKLAPGRNMLMCPDPLTVEYYPTYL